MGKKSGVLREGTPKYCFALALSYLLYAAFAGSVHGGLFPVGSLGYDEGGVRERERTAADIDAAQKYGNDAVFVRGLCLQLEKLNEECIMDISLNGWKCCTHAYARIMQEDSLYVDIVRSKKLSILLNVQKRKVRIG